MPVGQESPTRGMGVWAKADIASSKMEQSRYLVMAISPRCCLVSIGKLCWAATVRLGVANLWRAEPGGR